MEFYPKNYTAKLPAIILFLYVIVRFSFLPISFLPGFENQYIAYALGAVGCICFAREFIHTKQFKYVFAFVLAAFFNLIIDKSMNLGLVLSICFILLATGFISYYILEKDVSGKFGKVVIITFFVITAVYTVQTFLFSTRWPGIMRSAAMSYNQDYFRPYFRLGLAPYEFPHSIPCLIPALIMVIKDKNQSKWLRLACLSIMFMIMVLIYVTQATGPLLVGILAFILAIVTKKGTIQSNRRKVLCIAIVCLPFIVSSSLQLAIIQGAEEIVGNDSHYYSKLAELEASAKGEEGEDGDIATRGELLGATLAAISKNPIIGVNDKSFGSHNAMLDIWAEYGIIGFLPLLLYIIAQINYTKKKIPEDCQMFYLIGAYSTVLMLFFKGMFGWHIWFAFIVMLPLLTRYLSNYSSK